MGRDDLIWLHMLGDISRLAANDCSSPFGAVPLATATSANAWKSANALRRRATVMLLPTCRVLADVFGAPLSQGLDVLVKTIYYPRFARKSPVILRIQGHTVNCCIAANANTLVVDRHALAGVVHPGEASA